VSAQQTPSPLDLHMNTSRKKGRILPSWELPCLDSEHFRRFHAVFSEIPTRSTCPPKSSRTADNRWAQSSLFIPVFINERSEVSVLELNAVTPYQVQVPSPNVSRVRPISEILILGGCGCEVGRPDSRSPHPRRCQVSQLPETGDAMASAHIFDWQSWQS